MKTNTLKLTALEQALIDNPKTPWAEIARAKKVSLQRVQQAWDSMLPKLRAAGAL